MRLYEENRKPNPQHMQYSFQIEYEDYKAHKLHTSLYAEICN